MSLHFQHTLPESLHKIEVEEHQEFVVHPAEEKRTFQISDDIVGRYGEIKWNLLDFINQRYNTNFDHYHWLDGNQEDEVAYFLNEAGSNVLSHSQFLAPHKLHLWLGKKGFILGIEQKGKGFNAEEVHTLKKKENEGAAFEFFRNCKNKIFFDHPKEARIIYFEYLFKYALD